MDPPLKPLSLLVSEQPLALEAPTSIALQLLVLGAGDSPVTFSSSNLPAFANLSGAVLRLSPGYGDAGDHEIALTATAGSRTSSATLRLHITRSNTPPMWGPEPLLAPAGSVGPIDSLSTTYIRTIKYMPTLWVPMFDKESDDVTVEVEVIPVEQTGLGPHVATHSQTLSLKGIPRPPYASPDWQPEINFKIPLTGLTSSVTYRLSLRAYDSLGAEDPYSWVEMGDFTIAP